MKQHPTQQAAASRDEVMTHAVFAGYSRPDEIHRVMAIEYSDDRPFVVVTTASPDLSLPCRAEWWDFEYCKRDNRLYFDAVGSGGDARFYYVGGEALPCRAPTKLWLAEGVVPHDSRDDDNKIALSADELLARGYVLIGEPIELNLGWDGPTPNPFDHGHEDDCCYCKTCDDWLPEESMCSHLAWCDDCGDWYYVDDRSLNDAINDSKCEHIDDEEHEQ